ncbi:MAG: hypothetical protein ACRYGM_08585 [Janthinobacterium lividum]
MELLAFQGLIAAHIMAGSVGAVAFWVPVIGRKGGRVHKRWGRVFTNALLVTGSLAIGMSLFTLADPAGTHPGLAGRFGAPFIRGIFGWMMLHVGILTVNLTWYGWQCVRNRGNIAANRTPLNLFLQYAVIAAALNCAWQGWRIGQPLMMAIAVVGVATGATNLAFLHARRHGPMDWLKEHIKAIVGAGISVYTAFMAFGSVRMFPALALHPAMWAIPLVTGLVILLYHRRVVDLQQRARAAPASPDPVAAVPLD